MLLKKKKKRGQACNPINPSSLSGFVPKLWNEDRISGLSWLSLTICGTLPVFEFSVFLPSCKNIKSISKPLCSFLLSVWNLNRTKSPEIGTW